MRLRDIPATADDPLIAAESAHGDRREFLLRVYRLQREVCEQAGWKPARLKLGGWGGLIPAQAGGLPGFRTIEISHTALSPLTDEQIKAMLACELAHHRAGHVLNTKLLGMLHFLIGVLLAAVMLRKDSSLPGMVAAGFVVTFTAPCLHHLTQPAFAFAHRLSVYRADRMASQVAGARELIGALKNIEANQSGFRGIIALLSKPSVAQTRRERLSGLMGHVVREVPSTRRRVQRLEQIAGAR